MSQNALRLAGVLTGAFSLAACAVATPPAASLPVATSGVAATSAAMLGVTAVAPSAVRQDDAEGALRSFRESCSVVTRRDDRSGLTTPEDWRAPCAAAAQVTSDPAGFFAHHFTPVTVGTGEAFATGYFEPEIAGSRTRRPGFDVPVYAVPDDLVRRWPADMPEAERTGRPPLVRLLPDGTTTRYFDRTAIEEGALAGRGLEIAWAADPVEMFFLQIQGSGRLVSPEGDVIRIGYAGQNGHGYTGIGGLMRERGLLGDGPGQYAGSMQGIMAYIRENPQAGQALMRENASWVFFTRTDRGRTAGLARHSGARRKLGRGRSKICALWRAGRAGDGPLRSQRHMDRAGYRRRDQGRKSLRHLLGCGRAGARGCGRHERTGPRHHPAAQRSRAPPAETMKPPRGLSEDETAAWDALASTVTPFAKKSLSSAVPTRSPPDHPQSILPWVVGRGSGTAQQAEDGCPERTRQ